MLMWIQVHVISLESDIHFQTHKSHPKSDEDLCMKRFSDSKYLLIRGCHDIIVLLNFSVLDAIFVSMSRSLYGDETTMFKTKRGIRRHCGV